MADLIIINPSNGDDSASLFTGPDASMDTILESVPKGTMLKVIGTSGNYYITEYDNGMENVTKGGTGMTGTIIAYPLTCMYPNDVKTAPIANINNGTPCTIIDDSNPQMIKINAFTTEGWLDGYVEAKYLYRDNETPMLRTMSVRTLTANNDIIGTGTIIPKDGLKTRTGPGTQYSQVGALDYHSTVYILESKNGWLRVNGTSGWGTTLNNVWCSANYVNATQSVAAASKSDATPVPSPPAKPVTRDNITSDGDDWEEALANFSQSNLKFTANDEYYRQLADKYAFALGAPPKYNMDIDIQYNDDLTPGYGRVMNKTIMSNPAILSICPGKVKMFPNLFGKERDSLVEGLMNLVVNNDDSLLEKIKEDTPGRFSGRLYKFEPDTAQYALYLNALCRSCALMLGIGDMYMPNTSTKLKNFDYAYWTIRKKYNGSAAAAVDPKDRSIFRVFNEGLVKEASRLVTAAVDDTTYINFFLHGSETNVSEQLSTGTAESPLQSSVFNTISSVGAMVNYFSGSGFNINESDAKAAIGAVFGNSGGSFGGLLNLAENFMKGGKIVLPKMIEASTYSRQISCSMKFVSPYGNKYSVFLKCLVPICHLIAMAFPRQLADNMYQYPFVVRCAQTGAFNIELGVIGSLNIKRGGSDDTSWTIDRLATEWEVDLEIIPLVDDMMISSTNNPVLFCKNEQLLGYLSNFCGFDMMANNLKTKADMAAAFVLNKYIDMPHSFENRINDALYKRLNSFFKLTV